MVSDHTKIIFICIFGAFIILTVLFIIKTVLWIWVETRNKKPKPILAISYPKHWSPDIIQKFRKNITEEEKQFVGYKVLGYPDNMTVKVIGGKENIEFVEHEDREENNSAGF